MLVRLRMTALLLVAGLVLAPAALAEVKPHHLFSNNMVLQQGRPVSVWGTSDKDETISVSIQGQTVQTKVAQTKSSDGKWSVTLPALEVGGPFELKIEASNKITLTNVMVGEVWLCSGQSNMQWSINQSETPDEIAAASADDGLRLFTVPREGSPEPRTDVDGTWSVCGPDTVRDFTAVGYHFGKALRKARNVPIGLISTNVGGTAAELWTSKEVLAGNPTLAGLTQNPASSTLYNAMIAPLVPYGVAGAIWYQGESNAGRAYEYRTLFPAMIQNWRGVFGQGDFPFLFVQLAPFQAISSEPQDSNWAELREAQWMTLSLPKTGMAVITDLGDEADIHPRPKGPVGERLALAARAIAYGEEIVYSGPAYDSLTISGANAIVKFKSTGGGLKTKAGEVKGFTICGEDGKFYNAVAKIEGKDTVVVSCASVAKPVAVRFGWANYPVVDLWNEEGLPASPFRTDDFKVTTQP